MKVTIAGAHGKIAMQLTPRLVARGDTVIGLIRNADHADDVRARGAEPVVCDLEHADVVQLAEAVGNSDAAVFAAGAGPGSGAERKLTMDRDGAIKLLRASGEAGVSRFVVISSVGAEDPPGGEDVFSVYLRGKAEADAAVQASDRDWTIVRPGRLTDDPGTGRVRIDDTPFRGQISRADVAAVLEALLHDTPVSRRVFYLNGGAEEIPQALRRAQIPPFQADVS
jgi:nucleoside-diphosphate-sugar epimerase